MKPSSKAAILSAFVFPGVGHISLKHYISGGIIIAIAAVATIIILSNIMGLAWDIAHQIESGEMTFDLLAITEMVREASYNGSTTVSLATTALIGSWLVSVIDSYRIGRSAD